ncbi:MAG TPA: hypothetical protein VFK14_11140 [Solirubrobacterales bacterium]|nr:hypothetical protein [Solirubrobacterales bacterium]
MKQGVIDWERRWAPLVALASLLAVVLLVASNGVNQASGDGAAEVMRSVDQHTGSVTLSGILQALGFLALAAPLFYLFRAARARSERVRPQLVWLILVAPLFLAVSAGLTIGARTEAAEQFVAGEAKSTLSAAEAKEECEEDREEEGAKEFAEENEARKGETPLAACERRQTEDDEAENAIGEASVVPIVTGLGLAGSLGLVVAFFYTGLWAMRTGLLSRFWGSLGMAAGITFLLGPLFVIGLVWLAYFALMAIGKVPGGKPPAWAAGEAVPWPTPGEKAAAELEGESSESEAPSTGAEEPGDEDSPKGDDAPGERRRRKQR